MIEAAVLSRVTAESVHFATTEELDAIRESLLRVANVYESGEEVRDADALFRMLATTLRFPRYFGKNWNAVIDCLRGLDAAAPRLGFVLVLHHARTLWREAPEDAGALVEVWLFMAEERRSSQEPFHLVFVW
jgi:RNAse (barnase) inhibitor barstar